MAGLIFKRKKHVPNESTALMTIRISEDSYAKVLEMADESGESLRSVVSKMVDFAYENVSYESEE